MDQLRGGRRCARTEIVHFDQQHVQAAPGGVAREPGSVDAAADDGEVEVGHDCAELPADSLIARRMSGFIRPLKPI
jgi:hypothetical protein